MVQGKLQVLLVRAKGLEDTDFLGNMDPYAILICHTHQQKSCVASGKGSDPEWNETFVFNVTDNTSKLTIRLMDSDRFTEDDFVGEATIPLNPVFMGGNLSPTAYNVVKDQKYCGEIKVGLTFTSQENGGLGGEEGTYGGWKESSS